jgi:hypothetical protein
MMQQITNGMGVAVAAVLVNMTQFLRGESADMLSSIDIRLVFLMMAMIAASGCYFYIQLAPNAGAEVSGHRRPVEAEGTD